MKTLKQRLLENAVHLVVTDFMQDRRMFTAYDVTKVVKGLLIDSYHYGIQPQVHAEMLLHLGYNPVDHTFTDGLHRLVTAKVYTYDANMVKYYKSDDIDENYDGATVGQKTKVVPMSKQAGSVFTSKLNKVNTVGKNQGKFTVPSKLVKGLGLKHGDTVFVHKSSQQGLVVIASTRWKHDLLTTLKVDSHNNVRVSKSLLSKEGYDVSSLSVRGDSTHIVIE
jgi:bifunctional DNA-binding transcriptional regulator/antitoxin component of YhaV-PrlF toxin-antitoxin module